MNINAQNPRLITKLKKKHSDILEKCYYQVLLLWSRGKLVDLTDRNQMSCYRLDEPCHEISNNVICATSKASDQSAHTRSLIRAFASRLSIL